MDHAKLKHLHVEITHATEELNKAKERVAVAQQDCRQLQKRLDVLNQQLKEATVVPTVSEHAILRYLERVLGLDMEEVKESILPPASRQLVEHYRSGKFPTGEEGVHAVVKNGVVVTILADEA